jgi:hypothetical protein
MKKDSPLSLTMAPTRPSKGPNHAIGTELSQRCTTNNVPFGFLFLKRSKAGAVIVAGLAVDNVAESEREVRDSVSPTLSQMKVGSANAREQEMCERTRTNVEENVFGMSTFTSRDLNASRSQFAYQPGTQLSSKFKKINGYIFALLNRNTSKSEIGYCTSRKRSGVKYRKSS